MDANKSGGIGCHTTGYGKPPKASRFQSGKSGNPNGRPKGSKNRKTNVTEIASEQHSVTIEGEHLDLSMSELVLLFIRNRSTDGKARTFRRYHDLLVKYSNSEQTQRGNFIVVPADMSEEEFDDYLRRRREQMLDANDNLKEELR